MKRIGLAAFAVLLLSLFPGTAQTGKNGKQKVQDLQTEIGMLRDSLQRLGDGYADTLQLWKSEIEEARLLKRTLAPMADSLALVQKELEAREEAIDLIRGRFCYIRLGQRYRPDWVQEALEEWAKIKSPVVLGRYAGTDRLLSQYGSYYREVRSVFVEFSSPDKQEMAKNAPGIFESSCRRALEGTRYYQELYKEKAIPYLDTILEKAFDQIKNNHFDFSGWLDILMPEVK